MEIILTLVGFIIGLSLGYVFWGWKDSSGDDPDNGGNDPDNG